MKGAVRKKDPILEASQKRILEGQRLAEEYRQYIEPATEVFKKVKGEDMPDHTIASMAICMENLREHYESVKGRRGIREDTYTDAIETLQRHGFKIIAALMPSLVAEEIVSVQAMDRRRGEIYYLNFNYGTSKAGVTKGDTMIGAKFGQQDVTTDYTSDWDYYYPTGWTGDGAAVNFTTTARFNPIRASTVRITVTDILGNAMVVTDDGASNLVGDVGSGNNTVDYTTGDVDVSFEAAVEDGTSIQLKYRYDWERMGVDGVPLVEIDIDRLGIDAVDRMMRARWLIGAAYDLEKGHGRSAQSDLMTALVSEIRHEIDAEIMDMLLDAASTGGATTVSFDLTSPYTQVGKWEYYKELVFTLERASEAIFQETKRGIGNFIVTGQKLMSVIVGLDDFESAIGPNAQPPSGPHRRGVFRGRWVVYSNPFYPTNKFLIGWKGEGWMNAGAVYAPYMPAFTTPITALDDMRYRVGTQTAYGKSMINAKMYVEGTTLET